MSFPGPGDQAFPDDVCSRCLKPISLTREPVLLMPSYNADGTVDDDRNSETHMSFRYHPYCVRADLLEEIEAL